jgi:hypothetical protein
MEFALQLAFHYMHSDSVMVRLEISPMYMACAGIAMHIYGISPCA